MQSNGDTVGLVCRKHIYLFFMVYPSIYLFSVYLFIYLFFESCSCIRFVGQFTDDPKLIIAFLWDMTLRQCVIGSQRFEAHGVINIISSIIIIILMTLRALKR
jgi:hypothetical protein